MVSNQLKNAGVYKHIQWVVVGLNHSLLWNRNTMTLKTVFVEASTKLNLTRALYHAAWPQWENSDKGVVASAVITAGWRARK